MPTRLPFVLPLQRIELQVESVAKVRYSARRRQREPRAETDFDWQGGRSAASPKAVLAGGRDRRAPPLRGCVMKTLGEIEAAICNGVSRFEQDYMGRGPKNIHAFLIGDFLVVRLQGVLTAAEQQLAGSLPSEKGRDLLKQVRTQLIETARPMLEAMVQEITSQHPVSLHHDISTKTGEEIVVFTLPEAPAFRDSGKR
jgi:uncharacterized protein YbcI